ncbi:MAG: MerR family DNA-binding transcriptional regulator [Streptococcaceae bacterium]|jgi:DNA-binding transcriptional MerR regulator|nr:MerR family DNA-binding transcriptional regulator [Streptococcaceae bacterium]
MESQEKYTIKEVAKRLNLTPVAIRYYEDEGLVPPVTRNKSGYREFHTSDI